MHSELITHTGKLVTETAGDVGQTYHQSCQYQHEQESLTEIEIQKEYQCIRDSIFRVTLDPVLRLCEGPCPVGGSNKLERAKYFHITKSSRYIETCLKLVKLCYKDIDEKGTVSSQYIDQIAMVLKTHIDHNQKEYQAVLVAAYFNPDTAKFFRTLQKKSACFTADGVNQLKVAAELAAIKGHHSAHNGGGQSQRPQFYGNYSRGRGRGFGYQSNYRSRHRQQGHGRDVFHDLSGGQYSPFSPNEFAD